MDIKDFDPKFEENLDMNESLTQDLVSTSKPVPKELQDKLVIYAKSAIWGGSFNHETSPKNFPKKDQTRHYYIINAYRD